MRISKRNAIDSYCILREKVIEFCLNLEINNINVITLRSNVDGSLKIFPIYQITLREEARRRITMCFIGPFEP